MIISYPEFLESFHCTASDCPDTCCSSWDIYPDMKTFHEYQLLMGKGDSFGRKLVASVRERGGKPMIIRRKNGECPFLTANRLCELQTRLGAGRLCEACREYPAYHHDYGSRREVGMSFTCPEVLRLVLTHPAPFAWKERIVDTIPVNRAGIDEALLPHLFTVRNRMMAIAQNRKMSVFRRMAVLLTLAGEVDTLIRHRKYSALTAAVAPYASDAFQPEEAAPPKRMKMDLERLCARLLTAWGGSAFLRDSNREDTQNALESLHGGDASAYRIRLASHFALLGTRGYEYEKWLANMLYRTVMEAAYDRDLLGKVKLAVASTLIVMDFGAAASEDGAFPITSQEKIFRNAARELEYCREKQAALDKLLKKREFSMPALVGLLREADSILHSVKA